MIPNKMALTKVENWSSAIFQKQVASMELCHPLLQQSNQSTKANTYQNDAAQNLLPCWPVRRLFSRLLTLLIVLAMQSSHSRNSVVLGQ